jgi:hypothetical protein
MADNYRLQIETVIYFSQSMVKHYCPGQNIKLNLGRAIFHDIASGGAQDYFHSTDLMWVKQNKIRCLTCKK